MISKKLEAHELQEANEIFILTKKIITDVEQKYRPYLKLSDQQLFNTFIGGEELNHYFFCLENLAELGQILLEIREKVKKENIKPFTQKELKRIAGNATLANPKHITAEEATRYVASIIKKAQKDTAKFNRSIKNAFIVSINIDEIKPKDLRFKVDFLLNLSDCVNRLNNNNKTFLENLF